MAALTEQALRYALRPEAFPQQPRAVADLLLRLQHEVIARRFDLAGSTIRLAIRWLHSAAPTLPWAALLPARAWLLRNIDQYGPVQLPPRVAGRLLRDLRGADRSVRQDALARALARQSFRRKVWLAGFGDAPLVPLGLHCFSWNMPARWGFRSGPRAMALFNPFALAVHKLDLLTQVLEQGWQDYAPPALLRSVETPGGSRIVVRRDGLALWNHHVGESWSAGGFATFQAEIASQAARFDTLCASPNGPFLGFFLEAPGHLDAAALEAATARVHAALRARVRGARACLFVLQLLHTSEDEALRHFLPDCAILRVALPRPDYVWHLPAEFDTPAGTAFETRIANALLDCLVAWHQGDLSP